MFAKGDLRRFSRTYFVRQLKYYINSSDAEKQDFTPKTAVTVDVSEDGIGIFTLHPLDEGQILKFEKEINIHKVQARSAVVRWSRQVNDGRYRIGLQFNK